MALGRMSVLLGASCVLVVLASFKPLSKPKMIFIPCVLEGHGQVQRSSSLCVYGTVEVGYIKLLLHPVRGNLFHKQESMCQINSLLPATQVAFIGYPELLLVSLCSQTDNLVWLEQQHEWAGLTDISVSALPPFGVIILSLQDSGLCWASCLLPTHLSRSSFHEHKDLPLPQGAVNPQNLTNNNKDIKKTMKWCLSISKVVLKYPFCPSFGP